MPKNKNPFLEDVLEDKAAVFAPGQGEVLPIKGGSITLKITSAISNNQMGVYEITLEPGTIGAQLHFHRYMDETFIVTEGILTVTHGKIETRAAAGSVIYVPRFTPHAFANQSDRRAVLNLIFNPAQNREGFFYGLQRILSAEKMDQEEFLALYEKYDSFPVDPKTMLPIKAA
jgi:quercetin dioxygenase-like cupin family protein